MPYPLPTEHERRALFQWLRQASSLTAWRRLRDFNKAFGDVVESVSEEEQRTPGAASTISTDKMASILRNQDSFEAALERLARGDLPEWGRRRDSGGPKRESESRTYVLRL